MADDANRLRGGMPPKRVRKGERYTAEDEDGVSVKLKLRKRSSEELDDADEDGGDGRVEVAGVVIIIRR